MRRRLVALTVAGLLAAAACSGVPEAAAGNPTAVPAARAGTYVAVPPTRVLDTQRSIGAPPIGAGQARNLLIAGTRGVPSAGVTAVVLTVTASRPTAKGYVSVYAHGTTRPGTANINFVAGQSQADAVYAPVSTDGRVTIYNGSAGAVRLLGDVTGYFTVASGEPAGAFVATAPTRLYDSRGASAVAARASRAVSVLGHGPVPASGVSAVVATVTALYPGDRGYLTVYAGGTPQPATSNVDFSVHHTVGNLVASQVGRDGRIDVYNGSDAPLGLVVDVQGYFLSGTARQGGTYVPVTPERLASQKPLGSAGTAALTPNGVPDASSVEGTEVENLTMTGVSSAGYALAFGTGPRPSTSSLSLTAGYVAAGLVTVPTFDPRVYNGSGSPVRYTTDRFGYFLAAAGAGAISGTVRDGTSAAGLAGVRVITYAVGTDPDGAPDFYEIARTTTLANGTYSVPTLPAGQDYRVCFDALEVAGPDASTGFASRCYDAVPWTSPGFSLDEPASSERAVPVTTGGDATVDQSLPRIAVGTLTGRVTTGGSALAEVHVDVTPHGDTDAARTAEVRTDSTGSYVLHPAPGSYDVCYDPRFVTGRSRALVQKCTTAPIAIEVGRSTALDTALTSQGVVSGTVTAVSGAVLAHADVTIFTPSGTYLTSTTVDTTGHYTLPPEDPGNYTVCFRANADANAPYGYASECYDNVPAPVYGNGELPSGTTPVTITDAGTTTANASLAPAGAVSGTVTGASDGSKLRDVLVLAFSSGGIAARTFTDADGHYVLDGLPASSPGYAICFNPGSVPSGSGGPYAGQCNHDVVWNPQSSTPATGATPVSVTTSANHGGIDAALTD